MRNGQVEVGHEDKQLIFNKMEEQGVVGVT